VPASTLNTAARAARRAAVHQDPWRGGRHGSRLQPDHLSPGPPQDPR
jgi:hypothetical protein